jgi:phenylacetic acid degradation operon negative regulatory protein
MTAPDDDRSPRLVSVVPFLFGVAMRPRLPGTVLIRLLGDVGASESAARSVLARLRGDGAVAAHRRGRTSDYELAGLVEEAFLRARAVGNPDRVPAPAPPQPWAGEFHGLLYGVPEHLRSHRDRLRHAARLAGYAPLRPGLMLSAFDGWGALAEVVAALPGAVTLYPVTLRLTPDDARRAAGEAWRLPEVAAATEKLIDRLVAGAGAADVEPGPAALQRYVELALPAYHFFVGIPQLPVELLPEAWPVPRLVAALAAVREGWGAAAEAYVAEVVAEADRPRG